MSNHDETIADRLHELYHELAKSEREIRLLAVSKHQSLDHIRCAIHAGQIDFGENYAQEGIVKIRALMPEHPGLRWHFIGTIQSNKTAGIAEHFDWVHSVDRLKIAQRLNRHAQSRNAPLNICLQVNIDDDENKSGLQCKEVLDIAEKVNRLSNLKLRGIMTIPAKDIAHRGRSFSKMRHLFDETKTLLQSEDFDTLSMGMTGDYKLAIAHGATMIRIGTKIFGERSSSDT